MPKGRGKAGPQGLPRRKPAEPCRSGLQAMPLVSAGAILPRARAEGFAVGAFSVHTPDMVDAVFEAAEHLQAPVIVLVGRRAIRYAGVQTVCGWVRHRAAASPIPACLYLDHAQSLEAVVQGLYAGCTAVMYDGSELTLEENIRRTAEIVRVAHAVGATVEAEVGRIAGAEDDLSVRDAEALLARPEDCARLVRETGCDVLAPAVGSRHGLGSQTPTLALDRLAAIAAAVSVPLVLHGGSGLDAPQLRAAAAAGVAKVNLDTELRRTFAQALQEALREWAPRDDPYPALAAARDALRRWIERRIGELGSAGRARRSLRVRRKVSR